MEPLSHNAVRITVSFDALRMVLGLSSDTEIVRIRSNDFDTFNSKVLEILITDNRFPPVKDGHDIPKGELVTEMRRAGVRISDQMYYM